MNMLINSDKLLLLTGMPVYSVTLSVFLQGQAMLIYLGGTVLWKCNSLIKYAFLKIGFKEWMQHKS